MKKYRYLDLATKLKIYNHAMELRRQGLGCKRVAKIIQEIYGVPISPHGINKWFNHGKTPLRGATKEILHELAPKPINQLKRYEELTLEERLKLHEEALKLHSMGYRPYSIATALKLKYGVQVGVGAVTGWIHGYLPRGRMKTNLTPSPQLAIIAANSISDGTVSEGIRPRYATQMKDPEPVKLVVECLKEVATRDEYQLNHLPSKDTYFTATYRQALLDYLKNRNNILMLLREYPKDFIRMFAECDGGPSVAIVTRKRKDFTMVGYFTAIIVIINTDNQLLGEIQEELKRLQIHSRIKPMNRGGRKTMIRGREVIFKKDVYRLEICQKNSIIRYGEEIGFISKRKQEKLNDIVNILKKCGESVEGAIEWIRRYEYHRRGKERWIKRESLLTREEAISELSRLLRERQKTKAEQVTADRNHYY